MAFGYSAGKPSLDLLISLLPCASHSGDTNSPGDHSSRWLSDVSKTFFIFFFLKVFLFSCVLFQDKNIHTFWNVICLIYNVFYWLIQSIHPSFKVVCVKRHSVYGHGYISDTGAYPEVCLGGWDGVSDQAARGSFHDGHWTITGPSVGCHVNTYITEETVAGRTLPPTSKTNSYPDIVHGNQNMCREIKNFQCFLRYRLRYSKLR